MADSFSDQRIAEFSKRVGQDIKSDRLRITSNEINISKLNETVGIHNKRLDNLTAAAQGKNFVFQTDADAAYSKLVPAGAMPYAGVKSIGGKTVVWNQPVKNLGYPVSEGTGGSIVNATTNENKCSATALLGSFYRWYIGLNISNSLKILNHKYYISSFIKSTGDINPTKIRLAINHTGGLKDISFTKDGKYSSIVTCNGSGVSLVSGWYDTTHIGNEVSFEVSNVIIIDLTLMFGEGNEPATVEEFEAMFPADYYEYNAGELLSAGVSEVKSVGKNILEPLEIDRNLFFANCESYNLVDGVLTVTGKSSEFVNLTAHSKGWIYLLAPERAYANMFLSKGDIITISAKINILNDAFPDKDHINKFMWLLDGKNGNFQENRSNILDGYVHTTYTVNASDFYRFIFTVASCTLELSEIMITKTDSRIPYTPYKETTVTIPTAVQNLPGYGWSAGTAKNWVDWENRVYHREVGSVDLGTLSWVRLQGASYYFVHNFSHLIGNNLVCDKYVNYVAPNVNNMPNGYMFASSYAFYPNNILIRDDAYTDATTFKTAMSGVMLYYELAEPELINISDLLPEDNLIEVEAGGTLTFKNQHGDDYRIPVPSEVEYMIKIEEAL